MIRPSSFFTWIWAGLISCILFSCDLAKTSPKQEPAIRGSTATYTLYAKGFQIDTLHGFQVLTLYNHWPGQSMTQKFLLTDSNVACAECVIADSLKSIPRMHIPLQRVAALSSTHLAMLAELRLIDKVVAVSRLDLISDPVLRKSLSDQNVIQVGYGPSIQLEQVLLAEPDAVLTFGVGDSKFDDYRPLQSAHLQTLVMSEWLESHPLGRLEWIRLMGLLFKREKLADSIFFDRVHRYDSLSQIARTFKDSPTVMTGHPQGDQWFMTGGRNYFAQLMKDANAKYLWAEDTSQGGRQSATEKVFTEAVHANFWLNPGIWTTRKEALDQEPRVVLFDAWNQKKVYQHSRNYFWEWGLTRPDKVLEDLVTLLHPKSHSKDSLHFYAPLEE